MNYDEFIAFYMKQGYTEKHAKAAWEWNHPTTVVAGATGKDTRSRKPVKKSGKTFKSDKTPYTREMRLANLRKAQAARRTNAAARREASAKALAELRGNLA